MANPAALEILIFKIAMVIRKRRDCDVRDTYMQGTSDDVEDLESGVGKFQPRLTGDMNT